MHLAQRHGAGADSFAAGQRLQQYPNGYLLVVDAGLMRKAAQENDGERTLVETFELDRALALARRYIGKKSTILVTGDCAIGGLSLNGFPFRKDSGVAMLGLNSAGYPWLTWATGPHGPKHYGAAKIEAPNETEVPPPASGNATPQSAEPAAIYAQSAFVTVDDVVAFGSGPGSEDLAGVMDNTVIFKIIRDNL